MRYTRLRRQIESGTLIGTHGTPFTGSADKIYEASTKRKRPNSTKTSSSDADETEEEEPLSRKPRGNEAAVGREKVANGGKWKQEGPNKVKRKGSGEGVKVKEEQEPEFESNDSGFEDSEDEMPLAKLRKARLGPSQSSIFLAKPAKPYVSPYPSWMMSTSEVPRSMVGFQQSMGVISGMREMRRGPGLASGFQVDTGFTNGNGGGGWGVVDWARWQSRVGGGEIGRAHV